jgi:HNH endonuclease
MVSEPTRKLVRQRAKYLCEYCHSPEYLSPDRFTIDHIMPQSLGGSDELDNLALACHRCNERHYNFTTATDPKTQEQVPLFYSQSSYFNPSIRLNSRVLWVINVRSFAKAIAAINKSFAPIGVPKVSRRARIFPPIFAA